jgi:UDP-GlcNAc:undecaprenyl-phosphate GlcNAc-1-phosphate transferase
MIWIVGITNAFNLLDNMDGLSAGIALIGGIFLFLTLYLNPQMSPLSGQVLLMCAAYMGALLGFLIYNFNPASIFMGDAGSLFTGFMLAAMTVAGSPPQARIGSSVQLLSVIAVPILILFIPILDTGFVSVMRKLFRRPISQGGRDHSSHRMVAIGFSEKKAVLVLYAFSIAAGLIALGFNRLGFGINLVVAVLYLLFTFFFWSYLGKVKVYQEKSLLSDETNHVLTPVLIEITYRRRLFEVLLDFVLITVAYYAAYLLRFEGDPGPDFYVFVTSLPIMIACQILSFYVFGVYRGVWETTGVRDLMSYVKAITVGTIAPMLILLFVYRFASFSRAVFVIYWILLVILVSLSRLSFRLLDEGIGRGGRKGLPTLVYGAGVGGQMVVKEIETNKELGLALVGFLDDNPRIQRMKIKGYAVLGGLADLEQIIRKHDIKMIIVSFREQGEEKKQEISNLCLKIGAKVDIRQMRLMII